MNANEFADELEKAPTLWFKDDIAGKWIIEKLRQQQEQIDKLTAIAVLRELKIECMIEKQSHYEAMAHAGGVEAGKKLAQTEIGALKQIIDANNLSQNIGQFVKPTKELTDSEICTIRDMCHLKNVGYNTFIMRFARAILRKAQEK
jgi:hypothetical protein